MTYKTKATGGGRQWENTKHKPEHHSDLLAGGQFDQSDSVRSQVCNDSFFLCSLRNFSRANAQGANLSDSCSCAIFLRCPFRVCGGVFFNSLSFMVSTCIAMRRSYSHHGADSDYSDSLALRRWRRLISPCIDAMMNCDVLSPDSFTDSMAFTISCGTRAFRACDFAFVVPVAISIPLLDWWGTVYTEKAQIKLLTWATPKEYSGPHLEVVKVHKCKAPQVSLPLAGLLTTNDRKRIEVAMLNHTTHPQGRDSHNLNKYIWRFIALSTAQPRVITIEATSEQEARQQSPAGCVMVFAARIRQGVSHA
ncbi:host cell division inhibitor Icd-like protein [Escherichia albertii]|nr:host cell division inhibitor Icd-like protein [Escherichia albertii]QSZ88261.1 host cell division inhibitor Icd-like protein [Escherichia albertii]QSZ92649.1 host cell division inhibitor Icd-like protein [Escherichia albertii]QSZ97058.1 host cell division inhibitor Icd-like protein [Escherichia albertii]QTA01438.1 host cell division inhibitor Icd-like protein [Escherichia albertii]